MAVLSGVIAIIAVPGVNHLVDQGVRESTIVKGKGDDSYESWKSNIPKKNGGSGNNDNEPLVINYDLHAFDIQNVGEILRGESKPKLVMLDPLRYNEYFNKHNITFSSDSEKVEYYQQWFYTQVPNPTNDNYEETVTTSNFVALACAQRTHSLSKVGCPSISYGCRAALSCR